MRFEHPEVLWILALAVPALTAFLWWAWRKKRQLIAQFVQSRLLAALTVGVSARRQRMRMILIVVSVALLLFVLARPQWGYDWEEARQRGLDVIVAVDTSRSMLADDLKPNRLERAKLAALDLRRLARNDRLGLVAFSGSSFLQCPLTMDDEPFRMSVDALNVDIIPQGGTALAESIRTAMGAFKEKSDNYKVLVLFTDGEDHDGQALAAAKDAAEEGFRIFTIGFGTKEGELLRTVDHKGRVDFIKDGSGNVVKSRLNEQLLKDIAGAGNGFYRRLAGADTMDLLYERGLEPLPKAEFSAKRVQRWHERYQWFLGLTLVLLLIEMFLPERRLVRRSTEITSGGANQELRKAVSVLLALGLPLCAIASPGMARKEYEAGHYTSALLEYEDLLKDKPNDPRLNYNAGAAAYRARNYERALQHYQAALNATDVPLQQRAYYNLGNSQYRLGENETEFDKKQESWEEAIANYENAIKLNPEDTDSKYNFEHVKQKLEELKQQQQQQQNQDKNDQNEDQENQDQENQDQQNQEQQDQENQEQQNSEQQEQQQQDSQQQEQEQQEQQQQEQQSGDQQESEEEKQGASNSSEENQEESEEQQAARRAAMARMTPEEALKLLETTRSEETLMPFHRQLPTNRQDRVFRNW